MQTYSACIKEWQPTITKVTDYIRQAFTYTILDRQKGSFKLANVPHSGILFLAIVWF